MNNSRTMALAAVSMVAVSLGACRLPFGSGHAAPTGQVVATVDGQEITTRDLNAELAGLKSNDPKAIKAAQAAALQQILARKILAKAAMDQGIDKTPEFAIQRQRTMDNLLAQALEAKAAGAVPPPTKEEVDSFISAHPGSFADRKIYTVEQIRFPRPADASIVEAIKPLNTLDAIAAFLESKKISYQRGVTDLDVLTLDPQIVDSIDKLPAGEVFVLPNGGLLIAEQIKTTRQAPFSGDAANSYAQQYLKQQHVQQAVQRQAMQLMAKAASTVRYNKDFQPPAKPTGPATKS